MILGAPSVEMLIILFNGISALCSVSSKAILIRDREKVSSWIRKLDKMNDKIGMLERVVYAKYLVSILSGSLGLVEPFTSMPPEKVKPLKLLLPPTVYADLLKGEPQPVVRKKTYAHKLPNSNNLLLQDKKFYEQQLFPPEGIICYAAAFSVI
ncbi:hypothetical protein QTP88_018632 [Uroleucon formosanum]